MAPGRPQLLGGLVAHRQFGVGQGSGALDGFHELAALPALGEAAAQAARRGQLLDRLRRVARDLEELLVANKTLARNVDALSRPLAPRRDFLEDRHHARRGTAGLETAPGLLRIGAVDAGVAQHGHFLGDPGEAAGLVELLLELLVHHPQMGDVRQGVGDLPFAERPAAPVGKPARLVDLGFGKTCRERFVGGRFAMAADHRGDLRVEQGSRHLLEAQVEDLEVLPGRVKDLENLGVEHQLVQRGEVDALGQRVDRGRVFGAGDLGQAELGPVGPLTHELGIDGNKLGIGEGLAECRQLVGRGDELHWGRSIDPAAPPAKLP